MPRFIERLSPLFRSHRWSLPYPVNGHGLPVSEWRCVDCGRARRSVHVR